MKYLREESKKKGQSPKGTKSTLVRKLTKIAKEEAKIIENERLSGSKTKKKVRFSYVDVREYDPCHGGGGGVPGLFILDIYTRIWSISSWIRLDLQNDAASICK